jgi:hypothetical protein
MKKIVFIFISMMMLFMSTCMKDKEIVPDPSASVETLKGINPGGSVFMVSPNGIDDTKALSDAFDAAKNAGPGSVVRLVKGTYKIGLIEVWDFDGYFRGAGRGKTIISNLPDLSCEEVWINGKSPALLKFVGGNISMTDMTIHLNGGRPCGPGLITDLYTGGDLYCILMLADYSIDHTPANRYIKAVVDNVDFIAGYDDGVGKDYMGNKTMYNVWSAMMLTCDFPYLVPPTKGEFSITRCKFDNDLFGTWFWGLDKVSVVNIENNLFTGCSMQILLASCLGSEIKAKNNQFKNGAGVDLYVDNWNWLWLGDEVLTKRTHYTFTDNNFKSPPGVTSLYMNDARRPLFPDEGFPQLFEIKGNIFSTQDGGIAIQGLNNVDAKIWNNKFLGTGTLGVSIDGDEATNTFAENINITGNNFFNATYTDASIYLGPYSKDCKVVGVNTDQVIDLGVNNSIIGTNAQRTGINSFQPDNNKFRMVHDNLMRREMH